ncbi:MAG: xanthine dehydrogenase family protein subunit M [Armatimonadota bacterium]|nr:xanthine dehydrogenase family protein subunit M [Armatimonadota bacterium]
MRPFDLHEPRSVAEASVLLRQLGERAKVYAGGTELLLILKQGLASCEALVNIKRIPGLAGITYDPSAGHLEIGALTTHWDLEWSPVLRERLPLLARLERHVANPRVRSVGTIGGNLAFGDPHADPPTFLLALDALLHVESDRGTRTVPVARFYQDAYTTVLRHDEILTRVVIPLPTPGTRLGYRRFGYLERPSLGVAVAMTFGGGVVQRCRIAIGCVGPVPLRVPAAEDVLTGLAHHEVHRRAAEAAEAAAAAVEPVDDLHGSAEYKRSLVDVMTRRTIWDCLSEVAGRE